MKICKRQYRIVTDNYLGFQVQFKNCYSIFWTELNFINTSSTFERAEKLIEIDKENKVRFKKKIIKTYSCD